MNPLLVGEDNPYGSDPRFALYPKPPHSAGGRLCHRILQITEKAYIRDFDRMNLCSGKWSIAEARESAARILRDRLGQERVDGPVAIFVLLGSKVCNAFGVPFTPFSLQSCGRYIVLPHPSGRNRLWNDPMSFDLARDVLRRRGVLKDGRLSD